LVQIERGISQPPTPGMNSILKSLKEDYNELMIKFKTEYATSPPGVVALSLTDSLGDSVGATSYR
jgi:hypothetical protein